MKLFARYNRLSLTALILIFALAIVCLFFIMQQLLIQQVDKSLLTEKDEVLQYVKKNNELPETIKVYDQRIVFEQEDSAYIKFKFRTKYKEVNTEKDELVRALYFGVDNKNKHYKVTIIRSLTETQNLLSYISIISIIAIAFLLLCWFLINRYVIKKLLHPFYNTLSKIDQYNLSNGNHLSLIENNIDEFTLLNQKITSLADRVKKDYLVLKDFTANAAHEMQTPLSVIRNNIDELLQQENISEEQAASLQTVENTLQKLSKLNQSLLLLAKLESKPFGKTTIHLDELIKNKLTELDDLISMYEINTEKDIQPISVEMNETLADIIIANLLNNAIRFNYPEGKIFIKTFSNKFIIQNTSQLPELDSLKIFQRFYRHPASEADGTGLGLAIVEQAINISGFSIRYFYENEMHGFEIKFSQAKDH